MTVFSRTRTVVAAAALAAVAGTAGTAFATSGAIPGLYSTGVSFTSGGWQYVAGSYADQYFNYHGYLNDTQDDGNAVYTQGRVDGYGWSQRFYYGGGANTGTYQSIYVSGADPIVKGQMNACRDRGAWYPNNCVQSAWYYS